MSLKDMIMGKKGYAVRFKCTNCKQMVPITVPLGITVKSFMDDQMGRCSLCGCNSLEPYNKELLK